MTAITQFLYQKNLRYAKKGIAIGAIAGALWGLGGVLISIALGYEPFASYANVSLYIVPLVGCCLTDGFCGISTLIINIMNGKGKEYLRVIGTKPGKIIILASLFGGPVAMSGYYLGLYLAGPFYAMAITAMYPAIGAILSRIFLKEKMSNYTKLGIALCVVGAIIVTYIAPSGEAYPHFKIGIIASLLACLGWGLEGVICAYGMDLVDPDIAIGVRWMTSFVAYFVAVLPFVAGIGAVGYQLFFDALTTPWTWFLVLVAVINSISYFWYYNAINMTGASRAMALMITYSLWSVVFGWIFAGSISITMNVVIGAVVIFIGAVFVAGKPSEILTIRENQEVSDESIAV